MEDLQVKIPVFTVCEISRKIKGLVEDTFGYVKIKGEISGLSLPRSGHIYLSLKDESNETFTLAAVCFKGAAEKLKFKPEDGASVVCIGRITTYAGQSKYQLIVDSMELDGIGALMAMLEARKKKLAAEGLFDQSKKKPIPYFPRRIGVVTSISGAVLRDIIHRIKQRFPCHLLVWPVSVQGNSAADQISKAIHGFNNLKDKSLEPDVIIVARGGGSVEDLMAFNEEIVVRAAADSRIPLISAVGHETDTTLIDYASDLRAPTPTAAAELATPVKEDLYNSLAAYNVRLKNAMRGKMENCNILLDSIRLPTAKNIFERQRNILQLLSNKIDTRFISLKIEDHKRKVSEAMRNATAAMNNRIIQLCGKIDKFGGAIESINKNTILKRGFAIVTRDEENVLSAKKIKVGDELGIEFHDGKKKVMTLGSSGPKNPPQPREKRQRKPNPAHQQESLF